MMMSQESQPRASISARDIGNCGAMPKHSAQYLVWSNSEVVRAGIDQYRAKGLGIITGRRAVPASDCELRFQTVEALTQHRYCAAGIRATAIT